MAVDGPTNTVGAARTEDLESTTVLLARAREGDPAATDLLVRRYLPFLSRWAHRRLPPAARGLAETQDLVQVALVKALAHVDRFEPRREGAFLAYLRQIVLNEIRMEIRKAYRRPMGESVEEDLTSVARSPLEVVVESEAMEAYESALGRLSAEEREGVILRLELGFSHQQVAEALGKSSPDAARMLVVRALARITEMMDEHR